MSRSVQPEQGRQRPADRSEGEPAADSISGSTDSLYTSQTLGEQLHITPRELRRRQDLLDITEADGELLRQIKPVIAGEVEELVEVFYREQTTHPEVARLIGDSVTLARLKRHLANYILTMFDGLYDEEYLLSRLRVGMVHNRIGVPPKYYVAAMRRLFSLLRSCLIRQSGPDGCGACDRSIAALEKIMHFDLTLVFDMYIHSLVEEVTRSREELEDYSQALEEEVARRTRQLEELVRFDELTGLLNRRTYRIELRREMLRIIRQESRLSLSYLDLDGFKVINDTYGHEEGDRILRLLAAALRLSHREIDLPARLGGDEFSVIMPDTDIIGAEAVCGRLIEVFTEQTAGMPVTLSIGLGQLDGKYPEDIDALIARVDTAMYQAKQQTGHAIVVSTTSR